MLHCKKSSLPFVRKIPCTCLNNKLYYVDKETHSRPLFHGLNIPNVKHIN